MERLMEILGGLHPDVDFEREENLIGEEILDSFDIVTLISEIDDVYKVTIRANDITPENFNSAKDLFALIERIKDREI